MDREMPGTTSRYLILMRDDAVQDMVRTLINVAGMTVVQAAEIAAPAIAPAQNVDAIVFGALGVAVAEAAPDQLDALSAAAAVPGSGILAMERERVVYTSGTEPAPPFDETELTWGLQATGVGASRYSGRGIGVAVLDTGLDLEHPDFAGRNITGASFVAGEEVQDGHGHGTHTIGTACGPLHPSQLPRYGIAYEAEIYAGKVLSNRGSGTDGDILAGIQWAVTNGCAVVSMSLGAPVLPGQTFSTVFELAAQRALARGTMLVAAAGNESARPESIQPVAHPANCPSIVAVAAVDAKLGVAPFSNGGINPEGGEVNIAGPGVNVRSSWPRPIRYRTINGTSMATPHVAGIAALFAEAKSETRGRDLWDLVMQGVRTIDLPPRDVGAGLVQAP